MTAPRLPLQIRLHSLSPVSKTFVGKGRIDIFASGIGDFQRGCVLRLYALADGGAARALVRTGAVRGTRPHVALSYHGQHERYELVITPPPPGELPIGGDRLGTSDLTLVVVETHQAGTDTQTLPACNAEDVTPDDATEVRYTSLFVGTGGNVAVTMIGVGSVMLANVADGTFLKELAVSRVLATGTTATGIVGFYE